MKIITKGRVITLIGFLVLAGVLWGGYALQQKLGAPDDKPRYKTADVDRGSIVQFVTATGTSFALVDSNFCIGAQDFHFQSYATRERCRV